MMKIKEKLITDVESVQGKKATMSSAKNLFFFPKMDEYSKY